ncbi:MAG: metallophosphoesterase [Bacteroidales bacterium]|nr:metallophosphoesterase [Bacteroidales bacterium]
MKKLLGTLSVILILAFTGNAFGQNLIILHTNDTHSQIIPVNSGKYKGLGGYERREEYIKQVRKEAGKNNVLLLDAGDFSQGSPYFSIFKGDVETSLMNTLKYDAACLGNHEFDNGQTELARRARSTRFPLLCCNYDFSKSPLAGLIKPYTIIERAGKKIGIIGVLINLRGLVVPANFNTIKYLDPVTCIDKYAGYLKNKEHCDLVILLSHCGFTDDVKHKSGEIYFAKNTRNVDLIIGGHSHSLLKKQYLFKNKDGQKVPVVQVGSKGIYVGRFDVTF